jgi:hypothetical protein
MEFKKFLNFFLIFLLLSCGSGDDNGLRLGELIVGTWYRGWGEGDVVIEGNTDFKPEDFSYDFFIFNDDGTYNGMVREGSFACYDEFGDLVYEGKYKCDNNNLKLEYVDEDGINRKVLAQILMFSTGSMKIQYEYDSSGKNVVVTMILRKGQSSSSTSSG